MTPGIPHWARVGRQVVCIDDDWRCWGLDAIGVTREPMLGEVLTIAGVAVVDGGRLWVLGDTMFREAPGVYLRFVEVPEDQGIGRGVAWPVGHFRPLVAGSLEADVALFKQLLFPPLPLASGQPVGGPVPTEPHHAIAVEVHADA